MAIRPDVNVTATRVRKFFSSAAQKLDPVDKRLINKHMKHRETRKGQTTDRKAQTMTGKRRPSDRKAQMNMALALALALTLSIDLKLSAKIHFFLLNATRSVSLFNFHVFHVFL